jgi:hypothetical protein
LDKFRENRPEKNTEYAQTAILDINNHPKHFNVEVAMVP